MSPDEKWTPEAIRKSGWSRRVFELAGQVGEAPEGTCDHCGRKFEEPCWCMGCGKEAQHGDGSPEDEGIFDGECHDCFIGSMKD